MDAGEAWNSFITHCRDLEVRYGSVSMNITVSDEGWHTEMHRDGVLAKAEGTHTHDLLTYLAYATRDDGVPARTPQGQPLATFEGMWVGHSTWNMNLGTSDGRRMHVYDEAGAEDPRSFLEFQSGHP